MQIDSSNKDLFLIMFYNDWEMAILELQPDVKEMHRNGERFKNVDFAL